MCTENCILLSYDMIFYEEEVIIFLDTWNTVSIEITNRIGDCIDR